MMGCIVYLLVYFAIPGALIVGALGAHPVAALLVALFVVPTYIKVVDRLVGVRFPDNHPDYRTPFDGLPPYGSEEDDQ